VTVVDGGEFPWRRVFVVVAPTVPLSAFRVWTPFGEGAAVVCVQVRLELVGAEVEESE